MFIITQQLIINILYKRASFKLIIQNFMEHKKKSKSQIDFRRAHSRTMNRIRSLTKYNGVLQNMQKPNTPEKSNESNMKNSLNPVKTSCSKQKIEYKLPPMRKILRLDNFQKVKNHIPSEGYLQFETDEKNNHNQLASTISKTGIIIAQKNMVSFLTFQALQDRCKKIEKLKNIQTFNNLLILKPFLKWKKYSKFKRFNFLNHSLKNKLNVKIFREKSQVFSRLLDYFQKNIQQYTQFILVKLHLISPREANKSINFIGKFFYSIEVAYENMASQSLTKGNLSFTSQFQVFTRLCFYSYKQLCQQYTIKLANILKQAITKHFYIYKFDKNEYTSIVQGSKLQSPSHLVTIANLQFSDSRQILLKLKSTKLYFDPFNEPEKNAELNLITDLFDLLRNNKETVHQKWINHSNKIISQAVQRLKLNWIVQSNVLFEHLNSLTQTLLTLSKQNKQNYELFFEFIREYIEKIEDNNSSMNKIIEVQKKLQQIQNLPEKIYCGMLQFNLKFIKKSMRKRINKFWEEKCQNLPKDIENILSQFENEAEQIETKISIGVGSIEDIVVINKEIIKFSMWKQNNSDRIKDVQLILQIFRKINPRSAENFSVRYIQFKQKMHAISITGKAFDKSLPQRVRQVSEQKRKFFQQIQIFLRQFSKKIFEIRKITDLSNFQNQLNFQQTRSQKTKKTIQMLYDFAAIQKSVNESKQVDYIYKIRDNYLAYERQIKFYKQLLCNQKQISQKVSTFMAKNENLKVVDTQNDQQTIKLIQEQIQKIKKDSSQFDLASNLLLKTIFQYYQSELLFFKSLQIINKSFSYNNQTSKYLYKTVGEIYQNRENVEMVEELRKIDQQMKIIGSFENIHQIIETKIKQHQLFLPPEINAQDQDFKSVREAISILGESIQIENNKIKNIATCLSDNWKNFLKQQTTRTLQNLRNSQKTVIILKRFEQLRRLNIKNKQIRLCKYPEIQQKIKQKWQILFNHFSECPLIQFIKKYVHFQKMIQQIEQIQVETQIKIQQLLNKSYSTFPMLHLFEKNIVFKSIFDPILFLKHFFSQFDIKNEKNILTISSREGEKLKIDIKHDQFTLKKCFNEIQLKIKSQMLSIKNGIDQNYNHLQFLQEKYLGTPFQIISFIDMLKLQSNSELKNKPKIQKQIEDINKSVFNLNKNSKVHREATQYARKIISILILNRLQIRDAFLLSNSYIFNLMYKFNKNQGEFYISICSMNVKVGYHFVSSQKNVPLTTTQELYALANIQYSFHNPGSTLMLSDSSLLETYSFRVMKYYFTFPLFHNKFHSIIFTALKSKVIINFSQKQQLNLQIFQRVYGQLFKFYQQKQDRMTKFNIMSCKQFEWPIFLTLPHVDFNKYTKIKPELNYFFRSLKPVLPQAGIILQWILRYHADSHLSSNLIKFVTNSETTTTKNNRFFDFKRILLKTSKFYKKYTQSKIKPHLSSNLLAKIILKLLFNVESVSQKFKITYSCFNKSIRHQLFQYLVGPNNDRESAISEEILSYFQIKTYSTLRGEELITNQSITSIKSIINEQKITEGVKETSEQQYYLLKIDQLKEAIKSSSMIAILGNSISGKSFILNKYFGSEPSNYERVLNLHPTSMGSQIWSQTLSFWKMKKYQNNKFYYIFHGNLNQKNYPFFQKILSNKNLFYSTGENIYLHQNSKLIFECQNSSSIDPYVLVEMQWINLKKQQLKWSIIMKNKLERIKQSILRDHGLEIGYSEEKKKHVQIFFQEVQRVYQSIVFQCFLQQQQKKAQIIAMLMLQNFKFVEVFNTILITLVASIDKSLQKNRKLIGYLIQILSYCLLLVIQFDLTYRDLFKDINKVKGLIYKLSLLSCDRIQQRLPQIQFNNAQPVLKFQYPDGVVSQYFSLSPSLKLVPNYRIIQRTQIVLMIIEQRQNMLLLGQESIAKSYFIKNLKAIKFMECLRMRLPDSYNNLLSKIKARNQQKNLNDIRKISASSNLCIFIQDCALDYPFNSDLFTNIKFLCQHKQILSQKKIKKEDSLNFVIQLSNLQASIEPLSQLTKINIQQSNEAESIYNELFKTSQINPNYQRNTLQSISTFEHSQVNSLLITIQNLKRTFSPKKIQDWKHKYGSWLIIEAIHIVIKLAKSNYIPVLHPSYVQQPSNCEQFQINFFKCVQLVMGKLVGLYLNKQEKLVYNKIAYKITENPEVLFEKYIKLHADDKNDSMLLSFQTKKFQQSTQYKKLTQGIKLRNCVMIEYFEHDKIENCIIFTLKKSPQYKVIEISQYFNSFQDFLFHIEQKYKCFCNEGEFSKIIYLYSSKVVNYHNFLALSCVNEYLMQLENDKQFEKLSKICFVIQYCPKDQLFIQEMLNINSLREKSAIVAINANKQEDISKIIPKQVIKKANEVYCGKDLIVKLIKVFESINIHKNKKLALPISIQYKNCRLLLDFNNQISNEPIREQKIRQISEKIILNYCQNIRAIERKQTILRNALNQLQKINLSQQQLTKKQRILSSKIMNAQIELKKMKQSFGKTEQKYEQAMEMYRQMNAEKQECRDKQSSHPKELSKKKKVLKKGFKQALSLINRTEVSELKFIVTNNKQLYVQLCEAMCLALYGQCDNNTVSKFLFDINLTIKIRECKFSDRTSECLQQIAKRVNQLFEKMQQKHILRNIVEWIYYGVHLELFVRSQEQNKLKFESNMIELLLKSGQNSNAVSNLQRLNTILEQQRRGINQLQIILQSFYAQFNFLKNTLKAIENIECFTEISEVGENWLNQIKQYKQSALLKTTFNYICYQLLSSISSVQFLRMKMIIIKSFEQNFQRINQRQLTLHNWKQILNSNLKQIQINDQSYRNRSRNFYRRSQRMTLTNNQLMKMNYFLQTVQTKKKIIVINRQAMFQHIITQYQGNLSPENQNKVSNMLAYAVQIQEDYWTELISDASSVKSNQTLQKIYHSHQGYKFFITNSLGSIDRRYCQKQYLQKFTIIDFGISYEDVQQIVDQCLYQILSSQSQNEQKYQNFEKNKEKSIDVFRLIMSQLPNISLNQSKQINRISNRVKQELKILRYSKSKYESVGLSQIKEKYSKQFYEIYLSYEYAAQMSLRSQSDQTCFQSMNLTEKFISSFKNIIKLIKIEYAHVSSDRKIQLLKTSLILQLFQCQFSFRKSSKNYKEHLSNSKISKYFKIVYLLRNFIPKQHGIGSKDVQNFLSVSPLENRIKKILSYHGVDCELALIEQLPFKNLKLQTQARHIVQIMRKPQKFINSDNQNCLSQSNLKELILKNTQINLIQKLTLIKILMPKFLPKIIEQEQQKMMINLLKFDRISDMNEEVNLNSFNLIICPCDIGLWKYLLPIQTQNEGTQRNIHSFLGSEASQIIKFYCFSSLSRMAESIYFSKGLRVILVMNYGVEIDALENQLANRKIAYRALTVQKLLQQFWSQLTSNNKIYQQFECLHPQAQSKSYTSRLIQFKKYEHQIELILSQILEEENELNDKICQDSNEQNSQKNIKNTDQFLRALIENKNRQYSAQNLSDAKKIYTGMRRAQIGSNQQHSVEDKQQVNHVKQFLDLLQHQSHNIKICSLRPIMEDLRFKLIQTIHQNQNCKTKAQQKRKQQIIKLYQKLKKQYFSPSLSHRECVLRQKRQKQLNQVVYSLYCALEQYCRVKSNPIVEFLVQKELFLSSRTINHDSLQSSKSIPTHETS